MFNIVLLYPGDMRLLMVLVLGYLSLLKPSIRKDYVIIYSYALQEFESHSNLVRKGEAILVSYGDSSIFMDRALYTYDSIKSTEYYRNLGREEKTRILLSMESPAFRYSIFKNSEIVKYQEPINGTAFMYEEPLPDMNWEIPRDTLTISGYVCQKALGEFAGRSYEAWFSPEIPVSDGPYKFGGLPGLIFRLADTEGKIKFSLKGLGYKTGDYRPVFPDKNKVTRKEFQKRMDHYYMNRAEYRQNTGATRRIIANGKEETMAEFYEGLKKEYLDWVRIEKE